MRKRFSLLLAAFIVAIGANPVGAFAQARSAIVAASNETIGCARPPENKPQPPRPAVTATAPGNQVYVTCESSTPAAAPMQIIVSPPSASAASSVSGFIGGHPTPAAAHPEAAEPRFSVRAWVVGLATLAGLFLVLLGGAILSRTLRAVGTQASPSASHETTFRTRETLTFRRHWGSFGGESTGWNLSPLMAQLITGGLLVILGVWILLRLLGAAEPTSDTGPVAKVTVEAKAAPKASSAESK